MEKSRAAESPLQRKKKQALRGKKEYHYVKRRKNPWWKRLVQAELHTGVQISNNDVLRVVYEPL